jgi:hypothetical protein
VTQSINHAARDSRPTYSSYQVLLHGLIFDRLLTARPLQQKVAATRNRTTRTTRNPTMADKKSDGGGDDYK